MQGHQRIGHIDKQRNHRNQERENILYKEQRCCPLNVIDDPTPFVHHLRHGGKVGIQQHQLRHLTGGIGTRCHGNAAVRVLQRQHIVDTVAGHGDRMPRLLHGFDQLSLLIRPTDCGGWLVDVCDALTDHSSEFIEQLHDKIIDLEDNLLDQQIPPRGFLALLRKQLIVMRRYMAPQRDVYARLASERLPWMSDDQRRRMQDIADRLGRGLDEIDACIARTGVMADEIAQVMQENLARRTYTMSLMAMVFLPSTFLTGLFGVNLGGIPGGGWQFGFSIFCILLVVLIGGVALWLHRSKWL